MVALFGLAQQIAGAPLDRFDAELEEHLEHLAQGEQDWLPVDKRQHVGAEIILEGGEFKQVVEHNLGIGIAAQFNHDAHAIAVAFVANVGNAFQFLVVNQLGDALDQGRLVGLVGQFGDDHRIAVGASLALHGFNRRHAAHRHRAPAGGVGLADAAPTQDLAAGGEVGAGDDRQQLAVFELRIGDQGQQAIDQFGEVVGRDVGGHPHGDARGTIEQQVGHPRRHHRGLLLGTIEVVDEIDGFGLDVLEQAVGGEGLEARFGVSHGRRGVVVDRAEVAVTIDQRHAH